MHDTESLNHTRWGCKYQVVFIPEGRRKLLYGQLRLHLGEVFRELARHRESTTAEGDLRPDHVHMLPSIPPKYAGPKSWAISSRGLSQGEERPLHCPDLWGPAAQFCGGTFLGAGVLCLDGGPR